VQYAVVARKITGSASLTVAVKRPDHEDQRGRTHVNVQPGGCHVTSTQPSLGPVHHLYYSPHFLHVSACTLVETVRMRTLIPSYDAHCELRGIVTTATDWTQNAWLRLGHGIRIMAC